MDKKKPWEAREPTVIDDAMIRRCIQQPGVSELPLDLLNWKQYLQQQQQQQQQSQQGPAAHLLSSGAGGVGAVGRGGHHLTSSSSTAVSNQQQQKSGDVGGMFSGASTMPFSAVLHLRFSFMDVHKIDNLVGLTSLRKLQLDNNSISRMEGVSHLVTLEVLDLSFNRIKKIEGLEGLSMLRELILSSNEIEHIENLDPVSKTLELLSIGRNKISDPEELIRLRPFPNLKSIALQGNPMEPSRYVSTALSYLENIRYLDFRLVEEGRRRAAREEFQAIRVKLLADDAEHAKEAVKEQERNDYLKLLREANLLQIETLFTDMTSGDNDLNQLLLLTTMQEPKEEYAHALNALTTDFKKLAIEHHRTRLEEKRSFNSSISQVADENDKACAKLVRELEKKLPLEIAELEKKINNPRIPLTRAGVREAVDTAKEQLKGEIKTLTDELLEREVQMCEQVESFTKFFDKKMSDIDSAILAAIQQFFARVRDAESAFHEKVMQTALTEYESFRTAPNAGEIPDAIKTLLSDKDTLLNCVSGSKDYHVTHIDSLLDDLKKHELLTRETYVSDAKAEETQRDRARCGEIWLMNQHLNESVDKSIAQLTKQGAMPPPPAR